MDISEYSHSVTVHYTVCKQCIKLIHLRAHVSYKKTESLLISYPDLTLSLEM